MSGSVFFIIVFSLVEMKTVRWERFLEFKYVFFVLDSFIGRFFLVRRRVIIIIRSGIIIKETSHTEGN